jgi:diaminopimelate epimerase
MNIVRFTKMHGAGNDFILVDDRDDKFPIHDHRRIAAMATRRIGIGCEGVIVLQKSSKHDFKMLFFNPDGTEADLCGNGARCIAAFAKEIGAVNKNTMSFETAAGLIEAEVLNDNYVKIVMPRPKDFSEDLVVVGVPHKIVPVENLAGVDVEKIGREIRMSEEFAPDGTNVDFVRYKKPNNVYIRTYERGVESETGACGTGAVSASVIGVKDYGIDFPVNVITSHGYTLIVDGVYDGTEFSYVTLTGPVKKVFEGEISWDSLDAVVE